MRTGVLLMAALALALAGWWAVRAGGAVRPSRDAPVIVGSIQVPAAELEVAATRLAGGHPRRLAAARAAVASQAIERLWLQGEATERGLPPVAPLGALRAQLADALVGPGQVPDTAHLAATFGAFHERWRARTRCLTAYRDPYEDRCGDAAGSPAATCRWMGEATVCGLRGRVRARWLVVRESTSPAPARLPGSVAPRLRGGVLHLRSRAEALRVARALYVAARTARMRAAAAARGAAERRAAQCAQAARRARLARERADRARNPRLTGRTLTTAADACRRQLRDSDPYMFGFGMQDVVGQTQGLIAARTALASRLLAAATDAIDRRKLRPLAAAVAAGNVELRRLAARPPSADLATLARRIARLDARTARERAISRRLGLGDCLARPAA